MLFDNGIDPAPLRDNAMSWNTFNGCPYLIHDCDPLFPEAFTELLKSAGVTTGKFPAHSPNLNAYAGRLVRSIKSVCLVKIISLGERHLWTVVAKYMQHYHVDRNHQGLDNILITRSPERSPGMDRDVLCNESSGGLLDYYYRNAA